MIGKRKGSVADELRNKAKKGKKQIVIGLITDKKGHVFITMLVYMLIHNFWEAIKSLDITLNMPIEYIDEISTVFLFINNQTVKQIPDQNEMVLKILNALNITLPKQFATL